MSVEENLLIGAYTRRGNLQDDLKRMYDLFPRLRERRAARRHAILRRTAVLATGRALMARPRLLCLDEPTMGLAPMLVERVFATLRELSAGGTTIFMVEQNAAAALEIADRGYILKDGEIVRSGDAQTLLGDPSLQAAYFGGAE